MIAYTRFIGPTNTRGARIRAWLGSDTHGAGAVTVSYDHSLSGAACHAVAAVASVAKFNAYIDTTYPGVDNAGFREACYLTGDLTLAGQTVDGRGYAFVQLSPYADTYAIPAPGIGIKA